MVTARDAGRIRIYVDNVDVDSDGSYADDSNAGYICVTGNVSWSGFTRQSINTTCTESTVDGWGNIIKTYKAGRFIDLGSLSMDVDWNPDSDDIVEALFRQTGNRNIRIDFPAEEGETTGPKITIPAHGVNFTPKTSAMSEGDEARSTCGLSFKIAGDWSITDAV